MPALKGQVVWITGGSTGIGRAVAEKLARVDCHLAISARGKEELERLAGNLAGARAKVKAFPLDVTDREQVEATAREAAAWAGAPVSMLITSHGTYEPFKVARFDAQEISRTMRVNFEGTINCVGAVLPQMIAQKRGHLVPISSLTGYFGLPNSCPYTATKAALINFFEGLSFDLRPHNVGVTIVNPGFVRTRLTDKNEFSMPFRLEPEQAAEHILSGIRRGKKEIHFPWQLSYLFKIVKLLPYPIFDLIGRRMS